MKLLTVLVVILTAVGVAQAADVRISGTVVGVDRGQGTMTIEELTASAGPQPTIARRTVTIGSDTTVELVRRTSDKPDDWRAEYVAVPLAREDVRQGDFVTVIGDAGDGVVRARTVSVVRPPAP